jgi:hypothetical protein
MKFTQAFFEFIVAQRRSEHSAIIVIAVMHVCMVGVLRKLCWQQLGLIPTEIRTFYS